ncbi:MAG TPA: glycoside hydrolase family 2 TIM barrel-domain containing protein [Candidatus Paceibacterota bacterium]|nr:glycoside hydrolase family 2 TIM barrel-domain containing protein [Candidatus Paceibacterota bacterium]
MSVASILTMVLIYSQHEQSRANFDGVMAGPTVYVNGRKASGWDYGYLSFRIDATDFVRFGETNLVSVHGVNLRHDPGPLGAAFFTRAMEQQLEIMKDMGVNAIRTSHHPPAPELLDLCDRLGLVVWNETFDLCGRGICMDRI